MERKARGLSDPPVPRSLSGVQEGREEVCLRPLVAQALTRGACGREPVGGGAACCRMACTHLSVAEPVLPLMQKPPGCPQQSLGCRVVGQGHWACSSQ